MSKKREKSDEKRIGKRPIYDHISGSERTLSILIVFGIIAAALAMTCGYFMGNWKQNIPQEYSGTSVTEQANRAFYPRGLRNVLYECAFGNPL